MIKKIKKLFRFFGPGFITGASDDDPSGIATYSQTGAQFGYTQLWTAPFSFPFMTVVQEMCGRIGIVTGTGLAGIIRKYYSKQLLYFSVTLLFIANTINIGADLGAMASAGELLIGIPFLAWLVIVTVVILLLQLFVKYSVYANVLKFFAFSLFAYIIVGFVVKQDWLSVGISTIVPSVSFNREYLMNIVAILGTTISPYLFFWQTNEEVEEEIENGKIVSMGRGVPVYSNKDIKRMRIDTVTGMFLSNLIMFFIIVTTASTLHLNGITDIGTAGEAAEALRPIAGDFAFLIFALGIIGTGLLSVPILAGSASYAVAETFGWKEGLYRKIQNARGFYAAIAVATLVGVLTNFVGIEPFKMLYYTAIFNGIVAPPLMIVILLISNNKTIMGKHTNSLFSNVFGITITLIMGVCAIALLFDIFSNS